MTKERHEVLETVAMIIAIFLVMIGAAFAADRVEALPQSESRLAFTLSVDIQEQPELEYDLVLYHISVSNLGPKPVSRLSFWGHLPQETLELVEGDAPRFGSMQLETIAPAGQEGAKRQWTITFPVRKIATIDPYQLRILQDPNSILLMVEAEGLPPTPYHFQ